MNISVRHCIVWPSQGKEKRFMIPISHRFRPGLTILPRPALPMDRYGSCPESKTCCSVGGLTKTVWSNQLSKVLAAFAMGPPIWSGRFPPALLLLKLKEGVRRFPLWKVAIPEICHPPKNEVDRSGGVAPEALSLAERQLKNATHDQPVANIGRPWTLVQPKVGWVAKALTLVL